MGLNKNLKITYHFMKFKSNFSCIMENYIILKSSLLKHFIVNTFSASSSGKELNYMEFFRVLRGKAAWRVVQVDPLAGSGGGGGGWRRDGGGGGLNIIGFLGKFYMVNFK